MLSALFALSFTLVSAQPGVYECDVGSWIDVDVDCEHSDGCRALILDTTKYHSCDQYCAEQEHSLVCASAWFPKEEGCDTEDEVECWFNVTYEEPDHKGGLVCECSDYTQEVDQCVTESWDAEYEWVSDNVYCGSCKVYTTAVTEYWSCNYYCAYQESGYACSRAWLPTFQSACGGIEMECYDDFASIGAEAMTCECDPTQEADWSALFVSEKTGKSGGQIAYIVIITLLTISVFGILVWQSKKFKDDQYPNKSISEIISEWRENHQAAKKGNQTPTKTNNTTLRQRTPAKSSSKKKGSTKKSSLTEPLTPSKTYQMTKESKVNYELTAPDEDEDTGMVPPESPLPQTAQ